MPRPTTTILWLMVPVWSPPNPVATVSVMPLFSARLWRRSGTSTAATVASGAPCAAVSLCFADRLAIDGVDEAAAARLFAARGFDLVRYLPKPGLARHMGVARRRES